VFYSKTLNEYVHENGNSHHYGENEKLRISGTQARELFERGQQPPSWFMRPEISQIILDAIQRHEQVFVSYEQDLISETRGIG
jgi:ATP sulfurylase